MKKLFISAILILIFFVCVHAKKHTQNSIQNHIEEKSETHITPKNHTQIQIQNNIEEKSETHISQQNHLQNSAQTFKSQQNLPQSPTPTDDYFHLTGTAQDFQKNLLDVIYKSIKSDKKHIAFERGWLSSFINKNVFDYIDYLVLSDKNYFFEISEPSPLFVLENYFNILRISKREVKGATAKIISELNKYPHLIEKRNLKIPSFSKYKFKYYKDVYSDTAVILFAAEKEFLKVTTENKSLQSLDLTLNKIYLLNNQYNEFLLQTNGKIRVYIFSIQDNIIKDKNLNKEFIENKNIKVISQNDKYYLYNSKYDLTEIKDKISKPDYNSSALILCEKEILLQDSSNNKFYRQTFTYPGVKDKQPLICSFSPVELVSAKEEKLLVKLKAVLSSKTKINQDSFKLIINEMSLKPDYKIFEKNNFNLLEIDAVAETNKFPKQYTEYKIEFSSNVLSKKWVAKLVDVKSKSIVINEIYIPSKEDAWFELYNCSEESIDISKYQITNMSKEEKFLCRKTFDLHPDEYAVVYFKKEGVTETNDIGDKNSNGVKEIFLHKVPVPYKSADLLVLKYGDIIVDAVCWDNNPDTEKWGVKSEHTKYLINQKQWEQGRRLEFKNDCSLGRIKKFDTNKIDDWCNQPVSTPGKENYWLEEPGDENESPVKINSVLSCSLPAEKTIEVRIKSEYKDVSLKKVWFNFGGEKIYYINNLDLKLNKNEQVAFEWNNKITELSINTNSKPVKIIFSGRSPKRTTDQLILGYMDRISDVVAYSLESSKIIKNEQKQLLEFISSGEWLDSPVYFPETINGIGRYRGNDTNKSDDWRPVFRTDKKEVIPFDDLNIKFKAMINEINFKEKWIEIYIETPEPFNTRGFTINNLDKKIFSLPDKPISKGQNYFVIEKQQTNFKATADQLLLSYGRQPLDAICWKSADKEYSENEMKDYKYLIENNFWNGEPIEIEQGKNIYGRNKIEDSDSKDDFQSFYKSTKARDNIKSEEYNGLLRIIEVCPVEEDNDYAVIKCIEGKVNLSEIKITNLNGKEEFITDDIKIIEAGQKVTVYFNKSVRKIDDNNIYVTNPKDLKSTDDQLVLIGKVGIMDAVCWTNGDGKMAVPEYKDIQYLIEQEQWQGTYSIYNQTGSVLLRFSERAIIRKDEMLDTNTKDDWEVQ